MHDTDPETKPKPKYLRKITILDSAPDEGEVPVHVGARVLLDGVEHPGLIDVTEGWKIVGRHPDSRDIDGYDATVVEFSAPLSRVTLGEFDDVGKWVGGFLLDDIPVLVPSDCHWEVYEPVPYDPADLHGMNVMGPIKQKTTSVRVLFFVREIEILAAPKPETGTPA
jgi:hypothetical protein